MKKCPKCGSRWPETANFCPKDGTRTELILPEDAKKEEQPKPAAAAGKQAAATRKPGDAAQGHAAKTAVPGAADPGDVGGEGAAGAPEDETEDRADSKGEGKGKGKTFSETQWFMAAQQPDLLKEEASTDDLMDMQDKYEHDANISTSERARFTLNKSKKDKK